VSHDGGTTWEPDVLPAISGMPACPCRAVSTHPVFSSARTGSFAVDVATITSSCQPQNGGTVCATNESPRQALLYVTGDGGSSWAAHVLPGVAAYSGPTFVDGRRGWFSAVVLKPGGYFGETIFDRLYVTGDAGATWTPLATGSTFAGGRMHFINTKEGWALPSAGDQPLTILHTRDGGRSWEKLFPYVVG
jgi:photosystem II stability/assembly factor-like uncharacterized protein